MGVVGSRNVHAAYSVYIVVRPYRARAPMSPKFQVSNSKRLCTIHGLLKSSILFVWRHSDVLVDVCVLFDWELSLRTNGVAIDSMYSLVWLCRALPARFPLESCETA